LVDLHGLAGDVSNNTVGSFIERRFPAWLGGRQQQHGTERLDGHLHRASGGEALAEDFLIGMEQADFASALVRETNAFIQRDLPRDGFPCEVAQGDEAGLAIAARDGVRAIACLGKHDAPGEDVFVTAVQVENARELRKLVVPQKPRAAIQLRREDHRAVEGLENQIVLPEIKA
jgi:hypothetical protein